MLAVALLTAGLTTAALPAQTAVERFRPPPNGCDPAALQQAAERSPAQLKRLDEMPPAAMHLAVIRKVAGCEVATIRLEGRDVWVPLNPPPSAGLQPLSKGPARQR